MPGAALDRENRGKINAITGVPGSSTKGNVVMDSSGWLYTRTIPAASWNLVSPWRSNGAAIYPIVTGAIQSIKDSTQSLTALTLQDDRCYFGAGAICYVSDGTALKEMLESSYTGTILLNSIDYNLPTGKITISSPKTVVGVSRSETIIRFADSSSADYVAIDATNNVIFRSLTFTRDVDKVGTGPDALIFFHDSDNCGIYNCNIGDADFVTTGGNTAMVLVDGSDSFRMDQCEFVMPTGIATVAPALVVLQDSDNASITNNWGIGLNCMGSIDAHDCIAIKVDGNSFTNHASVDSNVGISVRGTCSGSYVCRNDLSMTNGSGSNTTGVLLIVDNETMGVEGLANKIHVVNNIFASTQTSDGYGDESFIELGGENIVFADNYVRGKYHGYSDNYLTDPVPQKILILAFGNNISIAGNNIDANNSRCAIFVDSMGDGAAGFGVRVINNTIYNFSMATVGTYPGIGLRIDATGVYLGAELSSYMPQAGIISNNTILCGVKSTAIRGCPIECSAPSWPPALGTTAQFWSIAGNVLDVDGAGGPDNRFGISIATISYSSIIGNVSVTSGAYSIDASETAGYTNNTNEYGTGGTTQPGANI